MVDTDTENIDLCPLCRTSMLMYKWPEAIERLAVEYRDFFMNGRQLDRRIDAFLKNITFHDAPAFHDTLRKVAV